MEVTKVPTPANPANSLGGSVNLVSKSAFERSRAEFRYGVYLVANSEDLTLKQTPHSYGDRNSHKVRPGFDFDYTLPLGKNMGFVITGMQSSKYNPQHRSKMTYSTGGTSTGATRQRPYFQSQAMLDGPRDQTRKGFSLKVDWRFGTYSVLSAGGRVTRVEQEIGSLTRTISAGTVGTPTPASGTALSFGDDFTSGATGRGAVNTSSTGNTLKGGVKAADLNYRFDDGRWRIEDGVNRSASDAGRYNRSKGLFGSLAAVLIPPVRVLFTDINPDFPGNVQALDANNRLGLKSSGLARRALPSCARGSTKPVSFAGREMRRRRRSIICGPTRSPITSCGGWGESATRRRRRDCSALF